MLFTRCKSQGEGERLGEKALFDTSEPTSGERLMQGAIDCRRVAFTTTMYSATADTVHFMAGHIWRYFAALFPGIAFCNLCAIAAAAIAILLICTVQSTLFDIQSFNRRHAIKQRPVTQLAPWYGGQEWEETYLDAGDGAAKDESCGCGQQQHKSRGGVRTYNECHFGLRMSA